jgi:hypothetical protein
MALMSQWHLCHNGTYVTMALMSQWHLCHNGTYVTDTIVTMALM